MARDSGRYTRAAAAILAAAAVFMVNTSASAAPAGESAAAHWHRPAVATGTSPLSTTRMLTPDSCAKCHRARYEEWSGSLHSRSVGAGLTGQLHPYADPGFASSCYFCHAPLAEQAERVERDGGFEKNPTFDANLRSSGVSCSACHVRSGVVIGPPGPKVEAKKSGHRSVERGFFSDSEFCAACHQLEAGYTLGGKLLVNTYREWSESRYAASGITCQACHMSGRRHLFRGIHDPEMTRSGVEIDATVRRTDEGTTARLTITNTGTGHYFPTYVTPEVRLRCFVKGPDNEPEPGTLREQTIARRVTVDLEREVFDTRLAHGDKRTLECRFKLEAGSPATVVVEAKVLPDEFYNRFFSAVLEDDYGLEPDKRRELEEALSTTKRSPYTLFRKEFYMDRNGGTLKTTGDSDEGDKNTKESN